jgi:hypothetical protein
MNIQPRTKQKKHQISSRAITEIQHAVERDSIRWKCSKSWIIATALAAFYNIDIATPFEIKKKNKAA